MTPDIQGGQSSLVERAKRILVEPKTEWDRIDVEPATVGSIFTGWVVILAAIPAVAQLIGSLVFGYHFFGITYHPTIMSAVTMAITQYILSVVGVFVLSLIIDALAPTFGGTKSNVQATKVAAYSYTAAWVAGILYIIPQLGVIAGLVGGLYSLYLLYLGLPRLMKVVPEKAMGYTVAVIVAAIVLWLIISAITGRVTSSFVAPPSYADGGDISGTVNIPGGGSVDLGKLNAAAKQMESAAADASSGTTKAAVAPAALQALLPETLGAFKRTEVSSSGATAAGVGGSSAEARYENGDNNIQLRVSDIAAVGALAGMASAMNVQSNRTTETGYEKTATVNGRMTSERWDTQSHDGSYSVLVANRFMVEASGTVPDIAILKQAVDAVGPDRLQSMAS